jgi:hypothetical protein
MVEYCFEVASSSAEEACKSVVLNKRLDATAQMLYLIGISDIVQIRCASEVKR